jgi:aspartate carbamoyltransferase catalytic subunit
VKDLLSLREAPREEICLILQRAAAFRELVRKRSFFPWLSGRSVFSMYYEASTRTFGSFEIAAQHLGAAHVNIQDPARSSLAKGESLRDTLKTLEQLPADLVVIRHRSSGAVAQAASFVNVPVINAGDGTSIPPRDCWTY